mgnify:FL=1
MPARFKMSQHMHISRLTLTSSILIILVSLISFWKISQIFFQQDEWLGLGGAVYRQETFGAWGSIIQVFNFQNRNESTRFLPITSIANYLLYNNFGLNTGAYGLLSLAIAIICALLINNIVYKLTNSYLISTGTSILWITNNLAYQAFTWIGTMVPSLLTVLFFLLGLYFLLVFNEKKENRFYVISIIFVVLSLFSKESGVFYLITYSAVIWFFFKKEVNKLQKIKLTVLLFVPFLISIIFPRLLFSLYNQNNFSPSVASANRIEIAYNLFLIPAKSLFHVYFPQKKIYELTYLANNIHYSAQTNGFVVESIIADSFSLLAAFYILLMIFIAVLLTKDKERKIIYLSLISFFASTLPFIIFKNDAAVLESRFYIFPALWASLLLSSTIFALFSRFGKFRNILMILAFVPIVFYYVSGIHKSLAQDILVGNYRKDIVNTVSEVKSELKVNNIFYFYTDNNGFYEFQSGFGQTLAVFLYDSGKIPKEVLTDRDYWDPSFEGLKSFSQGKFGYFMTYTRLVEALKNNKDLSLDSVYSFYWDPQKHSVKNVSEDIREKLKKDITNEKVSL